jgi:hypothetical protein
MSIISAGLSLLAVVTVNGPVDFGQREYILCDGRRLNVGAYSAPCVTDWDCDGRQDLLVGQFDYGRIRFYRNEGAHGAPEFSSWSWLMDGLAPLSVPWG